MFAEMVLIQSLHLGSEIHTFSRHTNGTGAIPLFIRTSLVKSLHFASKLHLLDFMSGDLVIFIIRLVSNIRPSVLVHGFKVCDRIIYSACCNGLFCISSVFSGLMKISFSFTLIVHLLRISMLLLYLYLFP
jgi:hypothetical protein